ncbi:MAG: hypothetical protein HDKAJFGB_04151 [Anaerolineae bacterium]|nr:hypothetical protein [Anaerolineae bacterium]
MAGALPGASLKPAGSADVCADDAAGGAAWRFFIRIYRNNAPATSKITPAKISSSIPKLSVKPPPCLPGVGVGCGWVGELDNGIPSACANELMRAAPAASPLVLRFANSLVKLWLISSAVKPRRRSCDKVIFWSAAYASATVTIYISLAGGFRSHKSALVYWTGKRTQPNKNQPMSRPTTRPPTPSRMGLESKLERLVIAPPKGRLKKRE